MILEQQNVLSVMLSKYENFCAAFDPGETTGWSVFNLDGVQIYYGQSKGRDALYATLAEIGAVPHVVIEDYRLFQSKALQQSGSRLETVRVIGAIESWATLNKSRITLQPSNIKSIASLWSGVVPKGAHKNNHHVDAFNHGYYYLQKNGFIKPKRREE